MSQSFVTNVTSNVQSFNSSFSGVVQNFTTNLTYGVIYASGGGGGGSGTGASIWGSIGGSLSNQTDLVLEFSGKLGTGETAANSFTLNGQSGDFYLDYNNITGKPTGFVPLFHYHNISDISGLASQLSGKLDSTGTGAFYAANNPSGYITGVDLSAYVTGSVVRPSETGDFYPRSNPSGFITGVNLSSYATIAYTTGVSGSLQSQITNLGNATGDYVLDSETGAFYPRANPSGYITGVDLSNYATVPYVTGASGSLQTQITNLNNSTGSYYLRSNPSGYAATGYITGISGSLQGQINTLASATGSYVTGSVVRPSETGSFITSGQTGAFYPRTNPSGYITGVDLSSYATIAYVTGVSGHLNSLISASSAGVSALNGQSGALSITGIGTNSVTVSGSNIVVSGSTGFLSGYQVTGNYVNTSQTGDFYPRSNPSGYASTGYITGVSGSLQTQITNLNNATGSYYPRTNPSGYITGVDLSGYATIAYTTGVSGSLQSQITNLNNATGSYYPRTNPSGYVTGSVVRPTETGNFITSSQTGAFYPASNPSGFTTGVDASLFVKYTDQPVYQTGNQTISGVKSFVSRPTVNGTGVLLSGEGGTGSSSALESRFESVSAVGPIYYGKAAEGSLETASVWNVKRLLYNSNGTQTGFGTAANITWSGRSTGSYI